MFLPHSVLLQNFSHSNIKGKQKGLAHLPAPPTRYFQLAYFAAAAAATAGVPTLTLICFGLASSRFGMFSVSTPFW